MGQKPSKFNAADSWTVTFQCSKRSKENRIIVTTAQNLPVTYSEGKNNSQGIESRLT
jgi:hypothetical protein